MDNPCTCDMFAESHTPGYVADDGTTCEQALLGPRISPHLFPGSVAP